MTDNKVYGWHFHNGSTQYDKPIREIKVGGKLKAKKKKNAPIHCCIRGMHACRNLSAAVGYAKTGYIYLSFVELSGEMHEQDHKLAAEYRKVLGTIHLPTALNKLFRTGILKRSDKRYRTFRLRRQINYNPGHEIAEALRAYYFFMFPEHKELINDN